MQARRQAKSKQVQLLVRAYPEEFGLSRYTQEITRALREGGLDFEVAHPHVPEAIRLAGRGLVRAGLDVARFFSTYPLAARLDSGSLKHFTAQQMAVLLHFKPGAHPVVASVHDILPHMLRGVPGQDVLRHPVDRLFDGLAMSGLRRCERILASSAFTRDCLVSELGIPAEKIRVIHLGVDPQVFRPVPVRPDFRARYGLEAAGACVLYVGAETRRKNLRTLLAAIARLKGAMPAIRLVKAGGPEHAERHRQLLAEIETLGLREHVIFAGHVPLPDLVRLYSLAEVFVLPSLYEGFGLPALEAMACGAAVVCSRAAALREVVGEAALTVEAQDVEGLAGAIERVIADRRLRQELGRAGLERARSFNWARTARDTMAVYTELLGGYLPGGR